MPRNLYCVIMAGGGANHFWPLTRENLPQHFIKGRRVYHDSFLRGTFNRFAAFIPKENILVVTLAKYALLIRKYLPELPPENIIEEPFGRKTAACIALAACKIRERDPEAIMIATPCDQLISDADHFVASIRKAVDHVEAAPVLMTLGILPSGPKTDYGYIQIYGGREARNSGEPMPVKTFTEKPDAALAEVFYASGEFFWNSGIFVWRNETILSEIARYVPSLRSLIEGWPDVSGTDREEAFLARAYADCEKVSVDYAVMEKTDSAWLCPATFDWADISDWESLYNTFAEKDAGGNVVNVDASYLRDCGGNLILSSDNKKLMAVKGLKNFMVVDTGDVLLICPRDDRDYHEFISGLALPGYEDYR